MLMILFVLFRIDSQVKSVNSIFNHVIGFLYLFHIIRSILHFFINQNSNIKIILQCYDIGFKCYRKQTSLQNVYLTNQQVQINLLVNQKNLPSEDQIMKKYQKHIRFQNIELRVDKQHTKDISRVLFNIIEQNHEVHKTKKYGNVNPTEIIWPTPIQFKYNAQPAFKFQTICQHQYGYEIQQLKALYYGQIRIKPEDFFHINRFNVYDKNGQKCGKVSFMIKVIDRQVGIKYNQDQQVQNRQRIRLDLVGRLNFIEANLQIYPNFHVWFQKKRKNPTKDHTTDILRDTKKQILNAKKLQLQLKFDSNYIIGNMKQNYKWIFKQPNCKAELFQKSQNCIRARIKDGQSIFLEGKLQIATLLKNKRFLTQNIIMANENLQKIGTLMIQMRIIQKKQLLDLMYSPKKLQQLVMQKTDFQLQQSRLSHSFQNKNIQTQTSHALSESLLIKMNKKMSNNSMTDSLSSFKATKRMSLDIKNKDLHQIFRSRLQSPQNIQNKKKSQHQRYYKNKYQDIKFTKAQRFPDIKSNSPYISYQGQNERSDFSPSRKVKAVDFSLTQRTDFTKPYKNHPGIGDYQLPSIWQRN